MMDRFSFQRLAALAALLTLMVTACTSSSKTGFFPSGGGQNRDIRIEVTNHNFLDMGVFVMVNGVNLRLGNVTGKSSDTFTLDPARLSTSQGLRLLADPVGSRNAFRGVCLSGRNGGPDHLGESPAELRHPPIEPAPCL